MRLVSLALALSLSLGCGGLVDAGTTDAALDPGDAAGTPKIVPGCPPTPPVAGQLCSGVDGPPGEHFYCHYFVGDNRCPLADKCTHGFGSSGETRFGGIVGTPGPTCTFGVDDCAEGLPCGPVFETSGRCLVGCKRTCTCDRPTGKLRCTPLTC